VGRIAKKAGIYRAFAACRDSSRRSTLPSATASTVAAIKRSRRVCEGSARVFEPALARPSVCAVWEELSCAEDSLASMTLTLPSMVLPLFPSNVPLPLSLLPLFALDRLDQVIGSGHRAIEMRTHHREFVKPTGELFVDPVR
jgi:hypothetical protein